MAILLVKRELALALRATRNYPPAKLAYIALRDHFNADINAHKPRLQPKIARIFDLITREFIIGTLSEASDSSKKAVEKAALKVSSFVSATSRASYQCLLANQNFAGNVLTNDEFRGAFLKHVGLDPPLHEVCLACMESYGDMGAYHHSTSCTRIRPATMGKCVKDGLIFGLKSAFGVSIPRGEPILGNQPGIAPKLSVVQLEASKQIKVKDRADFVISSCGTTFIVDSTSAAGLPQGVSSKAMRCNHTRE